MKKILLLSVCSFSIFSFIGAQAHAQEDLSFSGNVGLVSEYSFRGIAQSDEHPALQGGFDVSHSSGFYAGLWGSSIDFNDSDEASLEVDLYGGYSNEIAGINYDLGVIYYGYPGANSSLNYDFWEFSGALGHDFDLFSASVSVNYSPDYFANSGHSVYYAANVDVPLPAELSLSAHVGHQDIEDNSNFGVPDYTDWSLGLGYSLKGFDLSLTYLDTDLDEPQECSDGCAERVIFGVSRSF